MHPYYNKVLLWISINTIVNGCFTYLVTSDVNNSIILSTGQIPLLITFYIPFEYYYTWASEPLCSDNTI